MQVHFNLLHDNNKAIVRMPTSDSNVFCQYYPEKQTFQRLPLLDLFLRKKVLNLITLVVRGFSVTCYGQFALPVCKELNVCVQLENVVCL